MRITQDNPLKIENVTNTINNHFKRNKMKGHRIYMRKVYDQT